MQSNKQQTSNNYLLNTLMDGIKPFRYRAGVRSLLGTSDDAGVRLSFNPNLPPIGFRYENYNFMKEAYTQQYPINKPVRSAVNTEQDNVIKDTQGFQQVNNKQDVPDEKRMIKTEDSFDMNQNKTIPDLVKRKIQMINDVNTNIDITSETDQQNAHDKQIKKAEETGENTNHKKARIDIPGVSKENQFSSVFFKTRANDTHLKNVEKKLKNNSSSDSQQKCSGNSSIGSTEKDLCLNSTIDKGLVSEEYKKEMQQRGYFANLTSNSENIMINNVDTGEGNIQTIKTGKFSLQGREDSSPGFVKRNISNTYKTTGISGRADSGFVNRFSSGAANRIEQLRNSVHELTAKVATQSSGSTQETKEKQPEKAPVLQTQQQPVVIVKQASGRPRVPYAFWERSYLRHSHVGILR